MPFRMDHSASFRSSLGSCAFYFCECGICHPKWHTRIYAYALEHIYKVEKDPKDTVAITVLHDILNPDALNCLLTQVDIQVCFTPTSSQLPLLSHATNMKLTYKAHTCNCKGIIVIIRNR